MASSLSSSSSSSTSSTAPTIAVPALALPAHSERLKDISNSEPFTLLDDLKKQGKVSGAQQTQLKQRYQKLYEAIIATYANEKKLMDQAKEYRAKLDADKLKLDQRILQSHEMQAEIETLVKESKGTKAEVTSYEDEKRSLTYEVDELAGAKADRVADMEAKHQQELSAMNPVLVDLDARLQALREEVQKQQDEKDYQAKQSALFMSRTEELSQRSDELDKKKEDKRRQLTKAREEPEKLKKSIARLEGHVKTLREAESKLDDDLKLANEQYKEQMDAQAHLSEEERNKKIMDGAYLHAIAALDQDFSDTDRKTELEKARKASLSLKAHEWEAESKRLQIEERRLVVAAALNKKSRETMAKEEKVQITRGDTIQSVIRPLVEQKELATAKLAELQREYKLEQVRLAEITADGDLFISQFLSQETLEEDSKALLGHVDADQKAYVEKLAELEEEDKKLQKEIGKLSAQRELLAREASRSTGESRALKELLKVKNLLLLDHDKQTLETFFRLEHCSAKYEKMKNSRNRLANLTQSYSQACAEMKEKIKILTNEVDILQNESMARDKLLNEEERRHQSMQNARDQLKIELNKNNTALKDKEEDEKQQVREIEKLNSIVNRTEKAMSDLRKKYAQWVDNRNLTGIQLIDRNDELCILYEKANIQENILNKGDKKMRSQEEKMRLYQRDIENLKWQIDVHRKKIPSLSVYAETKRQLEAAESALRAERKLTESLAEKLETPPPVTAEEPGPKERLKLAEGAGGASSSSSSSSSSMGAGGERIRCQHLKGMDPEVEQLVLRIEDLEDRLNDKKEQLLEKELVLDEVSSLSDKLRTQAADSRGDTLELAKKINDYQSKIRTVTRKMMAVVSELSMYQATALKLEQQRQEQEKILKEAQERLKLDQPPTEDAEQEWLRMERDRMLKQAALRDRSRAESKRIPGPDEAPQLAITRTTADPRPNAYIPDELGIPKPYGTLAPFKPTLLGSSMRHTRKPRVKDVER